MIWLISFDASDFDGITFTMQGSLSKLIVFYNWLHEETFVLHVQTTKALISCIIHRVHFCYVYRKIPVVNF